MHLIPALRCLRSSSPRSGLHSLTRSSPSRPALSRAFHASRPNRSLFEILEPVSQTIISGFQGLHSQTGLPWYLTIPLGAAGLRMIWVPFQMWLSRSRKPRETVKHLTSAWTKAYRETARIKFPLGREEDAKKADAWVASQLKVRKKAIRAHQSYVGAWVEPVLAISFLPVWILSMDSIRRMSGDTRTVASFILNAETNPAAANLAGIEPGFATESLYWIPTLSAADPSWILPISYGVLATYSAWGRVKGALKSPVRTSKSSLKLEVVSRVQNKLALAMLGLPWLFTAVLIRSEASTAVVLYLLGTTATMSVQKAVLARLLGISERMPTLHAKQAQPKKKNEE